MQVKLDQPLDFIRQPDLIEFNIIHRNGANLIEAGSFSQNVKKNELAQIMEHNIYKSEPKSTKKETSKELFARAKTLKDKEEAEAKEKADADEKEKQRLANLEKKGEAL